MTCRSLAAIRKSAEMLVVASSLLWASMSAAVNCPWTNYDLNSQAEVMALGAVDCDTVVGDLKIRAPTGSPSDISNVDSLAGITSIGGSLFVRENRDLINIDGLSNVTSVGGSLQVLENRLLFNLDGLAGISVVGGSLSINDNDLIADVNALAGIESVGGGVSIWDNNMLINVDGLIGITEVEGNVSIGRNASLLDLDGLANLTRVGSELSNANYGYLSLDRNPSLADISGLSNLVSVGGRVSIYDNPLISDLSGLSSLENIGSGLSIQLLTITNLDSLANLTSLGGGLTLSNNESLLNIDGLAGALRDSTRLGYLSIYSNDALSGCEVLSPVLGWPSGPPSAQVSGSLTVQGNAAGCSSVEQILNSVQGPSKPEITQGASAGQNLELSFTSSIAGEDIFPVTGYTAFCDGSRAELSESPAVDVFDNTPVSRTLTVSGYDPVPGLSYMQVDVDITHSDPTDLVVTLTTPEGTELRLWEQGSTGGENLVGTFPWDLTPVDYISPLPKETVDGVWTLTVEDVDVGPIVREGVLNSWGFLIYETIVTDGDQSPINVNNVVRGRDYSCKVAPVTKLGRTPISDPYTVEVPYEPPTVPVISSTDYEDGTIFLYVAVSDNGGNSISRYDATCTDGTNTYTGTSTSSPITISGLTNGVAYTCSVTATNTSGLTSNPSISTPPIIPEELPPAGLPTWLLYEASK